MSTATTALLAAFDVLPDPEKQQFVNAVCRRVPVVIWPRCWPRRSMTPTRGEVWL